MRRLTGFQTNRRPRTPEADPDAVRGVLDRLAHRSFGAPWTPRTLRAPAGMTTWYTTLQALHVTPTANYLTPTPHGLAGIAEFNLGGGGRHPVVVVRYDAPQPGFDPVTNGVIDAWERASAANVPSLDPADFDVVVLTLRRGATAGSGVGAYDVVELGVGAVTRGSRVVLASVPHVGPQPAVQKLVDAVSALALP